MRRFTRLTNAFSKKLENHLHMVALYTVWYNYVKLHKGIGFRLLCLSDWFWSVKDFGNMIEAAANKPGKRGALQKHRPEISN